MRSWNASSNYRNLMRSGTTYQMPLRNANTEAQLHVKMFYAQRNMYLTGFTLFLAMILGKFTCLFIREVELEEKIEDLKLNKKLVIEGTSSNKLLEEMESLRSKVRNSEALVSQSKNLQTEYNKLADRYNELEMRREGRENEIPKNK